MRVTSVVSRTLDRSPLRVVSAAIAMAASLAASLAHAAGPVSISQVYGGGGNSGAPFKNDFVELVNRSDAAVDLSGWSVQYASATGTGLFSASGRATLTGILQPGQYYLVRFAGNATAVGADLPAADAVGSQDLSATNGKVVLVNSTTGLACNGGSTPCDAAQLAQIVDLVGYGSANFFETVAAPTLSNTNAGLRAAGGCTDTDNNSTDFATGTPTPRNTASPSNPCNGGGNAPIVASCPATLTAIAGVGASTTLSASDADGFVSTAAITTPAVSGITLDNVAAGTTLNAILNVSSATATGSYNVAITFTNIDATPQSALCTVTVSVTPAALVARIRDIQGSAHLSPLRGRAVSSVPGIVTAKSSNGFWFQDPNPDANDATSEGLFVFTGAAPSVNVGDSVSVSGTVIEFRPGGASSGNLTTTEITSPSITVLSSGNPLPAALVIGNGGRVPPQRLIDDDATGDVETSGTFDAATDGIDFYESLEGMRVQLNNVVAVGPTNSFGEIPVIGDNGSNAALRTPRGGVIIRADDFNPERVILDDVLAATPTVNVGDTAPSAIGVMDYSFGNFKLFVTTAPSFANNGLTAEITPIVGTAKRLTIGSFNVENLAANNPQAKFDTLAGQIVVNLRSPDVIALMEIQDNNGATNDAVVDASQSFAKLIAAVAAAGGPTYQFRQIDPVDDQDGGQPGGNIRVGFLFNPQRVSFIDRAGGTSTGAVSVVAGPFGPELSASPGRIDPTNPAFDNSRKPLVGEFLFNGQKLFLIANHFNSKGGDDPLFGQAQPPVRSSEMQRTAQATLVANFIQNLRAADADAKIVVLGDLNDFQFSDTVSILKNASLVDLVETLDENERYTYVFDGNSQVLDHILISNALAEVATPQYDVVHVNSELANQTSDHEPEVVQLTLPLIEVTSQLKILRSVLLFDRNTQLFFGTLIVANRSARPIAGPLQLTFEGLPAGVTLANATGTRDGIPYITLPQASLAAGAHVKVAVKLASTGRRFIRYTNRMYSGQFP